MVCFQGIREAQGVLFFESGLLPDAYGQRLNTSVWMGVLSSVVDVQHGKEFLTLPSAAKLTAVS